MRVTGISQSGTRIRHHHRLQFRATLLVLAVVSLMVGASAWLFTSVVRHRLNQIVIHLALDEAHWLAELVREPLASDRVSDALRAVQTSGSREHLAFVLLLRPDGQLLGRDVHDSACWKTFVARWGENSEKRRPFELHRPTPLGCAEAPEAHVYRVPIFRQANRSGTTSNQVVGQLVIGVIEPMHRDIISGIEGTALATVCVICLISIPITMVMMRRLTQPLRRIARATAILARGDRPPRLPATRTDEIGLLARSFNGMAEKLATAHEQLIKANADLECQVEQRTCELRRVNGLLNHEIETKNEFLRTVSHDLNAPLRNISGMATMIQRRFHDDLPEEVLKRLERISANVDIETSMLDDLLNLSRLRTQPGEPEDVSLDQLIGQIIGALRHDMVEQGIICQVEPGLPVLHVEPSLARQVFLNLIDNAVKYMGDQPDRRISISHHESNDGMVCIVVADTGQGMDADEHDRVFQVFRRGKSSQTTQVEGRGIGLTSVRMVVERWGGSMDLESKVGEGSKFTVRIPEDRVVHDGRLRSGHDKSDLGSGVQAA